VNKDYLFMIVISLQRSCYQQHDSKSLLCRC